MPHRLATLAARRRRILALPLVVALLAALAPPAHAQGGPGSAGVAIGDAGTAISTLRMPTNSIPDTSLTPELGELVGDGRFEAGFGVGNAHADSAAALPFERSVAQATGYSTQHSPGQRNSSGLIQTAVPDNSRPETGPLRPDHPDITTVVTPDAMRGSAHARWSDDTGPCVGTIAQSTTDVDELEMGSAVPTLPDMPVDQLPLSGADRLPKGLSIDASLGTLGGLLSGPDPDEPGSVLALPDGLSTTSSVGVTDTGNGRTVQSSSEVDVETVRLLSGSKLGMTGTVRTAPELTATSGGTADTSDVDSTVAEIEFRRGDDRLFTLDSDDDQRDIPIGIPKRALDELPDSQELKAQPIVGGVAEDSDGDLVRLSRDEREKVTDLFILRLSVGGLNTESSEINDPFDGMRQDATARMLDVQLLPTEDLADLMSSESDDAPDALPYEVPAALAQYAVGEQSARAAAPEGGARCGRPASETEAATPAALATSSTASVSVPLLWAGAGAILAGVAVLIAVPRRRRHTTVTPSPHPRE